MRAATCAACLMLLGGCVPIPPRHAPTARANVPRGLPDWLQPGRTTLADVLLHLGEPDSTTDDERTLVWVSVDRLGGGLLLIRAGSATGGLAAVAERYRRLVVRFGGDRIVTERWLQSAVCTSGMWGAGTASSEFGGDCLPPLPDERLPAP